MSLHNAKHLAHNMRTRATERGDTEAADLAHVLYEIADSLERETHDIKHVLQDIQNQVRNLR